MVVRLISTQPFLEIWKYNSVLALLQSATPELLLAPTILFLILQGMFVRGVILPVSTSQ